MFNAYECEIVCLCEKGGLENQLIVAAIICILEDEHTHKHKFTLVVNSIVLYL